MVELNTFRLLFLCRTLFVPWPPRVVQSNHIGNPRSWWLQTWNPLHWRGLVGCSYSWRRSNWVIAHELVGASLSLLGWFCLPFRAKVPEHCPKDKGYKGREQESDGCIRSISPVWPMLFPETSNALGVLQNRDLLFRAEGPLVPWSGLCFSCKLKIVST